MQYDGIMNITTMLRNALLYNIIRRQAITFGDRKNCVNKIFKK